MRERVVVSGADALRVYAGWDAPPCVQTALEGAGALCAGNGALYAACVRSGSVWRLDAQSLMPTGLFAAGPGVCRLLLSGDGARLYTLCAEADSLLMLDARTGAPLIVNRVGVSPADMALHAGHGVIAVAGGACGEVILLCAQSLHVLRRLRARGHVACVALGEDAVYALSMPDPMSAMLTTFTEGGARELPLGGMPGALCIAGGELAAATHERVYWVSPDGKRVLRSVQAPGRADRLLLHAGGMLMTDVWSETLYAGTGKGWRCVDCAARDAVVIGVQERRSRKA